MTDMEDLWNTLPTGEPPTAHIVHQGRVRTMRRRAVRRPLIAVGVTTALAGTFLVGTAVGGGSGRVPGGPSTHPAVISPVAFQADLAPAASCDDLLTSYVDRALGKVTAWGWNRPYRGLVFGVYDGVRTSVKAVNERGLAPLSTHRVTAGETGTNVQEAGVDEPDTVKTNGSILVRVRDHDLLVYDVTGPTTELLSTLALSRVDSGEILLSGDTVVVIGADAVSPLSQTTGVRRGTRVETVSLADPTNPQVMSNVTYRAAVSSVRQQGDTIRMVLSAGLPNFTFVQPRRGLSAKRALRHNRAVVRHSTLGAWLPVYNTGSGRQGLLDCDNVAVPPEEAGLDTVAVVTFSATSPTTPQAFGLAGATTVAYESADHLYLVSTPQTWWGCAGCGMPMARDGGSGTSYLFQFDLTDDQAVHVASGEVEGTIRDRWSMDEAGGELRVLVGPSSETARTNSIVTFERRGAKLVETGRLDGIGSGEDIKSVRWQDDLALVVTYRQIDPLFVIDLTGKPRILSKLEVPGYSSYLHPLGTDRLIGLGYGRAANGWGAQMGLFAVDDLTNVDRLDVTHFGRGTRPVAAQDPRAFTWLPEHRTVLTVIQRGRTGWLSISRLSGNQLHNRMVKVEYGSDIAKVRTIGMPDGRVVLVTGEDVRFLDL